MKNVVLLAAGLALALSAGCSNMFSTETKTTPTPTTPGTLAAGQWSSVSAATSLTDTCTNFKWTILDVNATSGSGTFTATCNGNMQVSGSAQGTINGTEVTWTAQATGVMPGGVTCPISLQGTATYDGTQFRIPYTGTTCMGPISGTEILRQK